MVAQRVCGAQEVAIHVLAGGSLVKVAVPDLSPAAGGSSGVLCRLLPGPTVQPDSSSALLSLNGADSTPFRKLLPPWAHLRGRSQSGHISRVFSRTLLELPSALRPEGTCRYSNWHQTCAPQDKG